MTNRFVGVYWTFPVNWAGFRRLPGDGWDVDAAAAASRTIRYQRERVRQWVEEQKGVLIGEVAFIDVSPDRATSATEAELPRRVAESLRAGAALAAVRFEDSHHWRRNPFLRRAADALRMELAPVEPDPVVIDGVLFDPARHFAGWRRRDKEATTRLRLEAYAGLRAAAAEAPEGEGRWRHIADKLNADGTKTTRGGTWTAENVRKQFGRLRLPG